MTSEELFEQTLKPILNELEILRAKKHRIMLSSFAAAIILGLVIGGASSPLAGIFTGIVAFFIGMIIAQHAAPTLKRDFKDQVVKKIIQTLHPGLDYQPEAGFSQEEFTASELFSTPIDRFASEDMVTGELDGVRLRFSEINAEHKQLNTSDKTSVESYVAIFHGILLELDYHQKFAGKTLILSRNENGDAPTSLPEIKLDDPDFEQQFSIHGDNPEAVFPISMLTERLLKLKERLQCDISLLFANDKILLAIPRKKDIFELSDFSHLNRPETVAGIANDLTTLTRIAGELDWKNQ